MNHPVFPMNYYSEREYGLLISAANGCHHCVFNAVNQADDIDDLPAVIAACKEESSRRDG